MPSHVLKQPIIGPDNRQYVKLDVPEPTLAGLASYEMVMAETGSPTAALIAMIAAEVGWPREIVSKIPQSEMEAVSALVRPFSKIEAPGPTGEPSPPTSPTS
ncbi:hypothetical protein [Methylobacterium hispanicum]|uniref:hypothetical protein n=1 Tax=Methylobacterium hispanicum TaxID=270350 RepID=UPI002F30F18A